jgi:hypothetical protein
MNDTWCLLESAWVCSASDPHLPTTQCACAEFEDFAKQRNGCSGREKHLLRSLKISFWLFFLPSSIDSHQTAE